MKKLSIVGLLGLLVLLATAATYTAGMLELSQTWTGINKFFGGIWVKNDPWYDIRAYGALCDGTSDDSTAIQAAITAAMAQGGGRVVVPNNNSGTCNFATPLNASGARGVTIEGVGSTSGYNTTKAVLKYTGTTSPAVNFQSSYKSGLKNINVFYTSNSFTGTLVDFSHSVAATDSFGCKVENSYLSGTPSTVHSAAFLLNLDKAISCSVYESNFGGAAIAIQGAAGSSSYSNQITIKGSHFSDSTGSIVTSMIRNPGQAWIINGNTFEMGAGAGTPAITDFDSTATQSNSQGTEFSGNWIGDTGAGFGVLVNAGFGWEISGNYISGGLSSGTATAIKFRDSMRGGSVHANEIANCLNGIDLGSSGAYINVFGNNNTSTNPYVGTQAAGRTENPGTGLATEWGGVRSGNTTRPTCNANMRGSFWYAPGAAGVKDTVDVCGKDGADVYAWRSIY